MYKIVKHDNWCAWDRYKKVEGINNYVEDTILFESEDWLETLEHFTSIVFDDLEYKKDVDKHYGYVKKYGKLAYFRYDYLEDILKKTKVKNCEITSVDKTYKHFITIYIKEEK